MRISRTDTFKRNYQKLPQPVKKAAQKQLALLLSNPDHPSLNIKRIQGAKGIWEGRVTRAYRFTFQITDDTYVLRKIGTHDILDRP